MTEVEPVDDAATEHHIGYVLTNDFGRMVILQRRSEKLRLRLSPTCSRSGATSWPSE